MYHIGWFSTGRDEAACELLRTVHDSIEQGEIEAEIPFVFSNREPGETKESDLFFKLVKGYRIPLICSSYSRFRASRGSAMLGKGKSIPSWRLEYDRDVISRLRDFSPDLCVLAGYMLIVEEEMCHEYNMINLHPAAPGGPTGTWQEVIWKLMEDRAGETGVMMHLVTPELDKGPPVTYCTFPIKGNPFDKHWDEIEGYSIGDIKRRQGENNPLFGLIRWHGLARELPLIVSTLKAFSQGKVSIEGGKVISAEGEVVEGYNMSEEIDELVKGGLHSEIHLL